MYEISETFIQILSSQNTQVNHKQLPKPGPVMGLVCINRYCLILTVLGMLFFYYRNNTFQLAGDAD